MGQYYRNTFLKKNWKTAKQPVKASLCPYDFANGAKLMEFSYIGNTLMRQIEHLLATKFYGKPFVCVGDYADEKKTFYYKGNNLDVYSCAHDFEDTDDYKALVRSLPTFDFERMYDDIPYYRYAVNYSKKEYVVLPEHDEKEWTIHPISLLCADGNGRGGGDFWDGNGIEFIGRWAYDRIGVTNNKKAISGMKEIVPNFKEEGY